MAKAEIHDSDYQFTLKQVAQYVAYLTKVALSYGVTEERDKQLDLETFIFEQLIANKLSFLMFNEGLASLLTEKNILTAEEYSTLYQCLVHDPIRKPEKYIQYYGNSFRNVLHKFIKSDYDLILDFATKAVNRKEENCLVTAEDLQILHQDPEKIEQISKKLLSRESVSNLHANYSFFETWDELPKDLQCILLPVFNKEEFANLSNMDIPTSLKNYLFHLLGTSLDSKWSPFPGDYQNNEIMKSYEKRVLKREKKYDPYEN